MTLPAALGVVGLTAARSFAGALLPLMPHAAVLIFDEELRLHYAGGQALRAVGYDPTAMVGRHLRDVGPVAAWESVEPVYRRALGGEEFAVDYQAGNGRTYRVHGAPVRDDSGQVQGGMLVIHDAVSPAEERLTSRLRQQSAVAELGKLAVSGAAEIEALMEHAVRLVSETLTVDAVSVVELDRDRREYLVRMDTTGRFTGARVPVAGSLAEKVLAAEAPLIIDDAMLPEHGIPTALLELGARSIMYIPIGPVGDPFGMVGAFSSRTAAFTADDVHFLEAIAFVLNEAASRAQADIELRRQALHDSLTGLPNRMLLGDRLEQTLAVSGRAGMRTAVLFVDLDHFKVINDSLGHHAGDEALRAVAARLRSAVRASDTVARLGGDEFVIVVAAIEEVDDAVRIAETVLALLASPILIGDEQVYVRASVGICLARPDASLDPRELISEADAAMYCAKARGRNRYEVAGPIQPLPPPNRVIVERDLRRALADGDLRLVFQPLVRLADGAPVGAEVLLRWQHPSEGYIWPAEFLGVSEQTGLIVAIGEWTLKQACRHAVRWHEERDFLLTINVSASQLADAGILTAVRDALDISGLRPECLGLELTEQVLIGDEQDVLRTLTELKELGVTLLLDDFGTGFSSLSHLKRFPIDIVKIDRSFIEGLGQVDSRGDDAAIVSAIVAMSRATGKRVIAEGIETEAQVRALMALGCEAGQGYLYSCPMKVHHFTRWLAGEAEPLHAF